MIVIREQNDVSNQHSDWLKNCTLPQNSDSRCRAIFYARTLSACLSIFGCLVTFMLIIVYKKHKSFTQRLVLYLLLPSLLVAGLTLYPDIGKNYSCSMIGLFFNFGALSQRCIIMCITSHLFLLTTSHRIPHLEIIFHVIIWAFPMFISLIPVLNKNDGSHYGPAGVWCWIEDETAYENELRLWCFYFWLWLSVAVDFVAFPWIVVRVRRQMMLRGDTSTDLEKERQYKAHIRPLIFFPLLDFFMAIPVTINRVQNWLNPSEPVFWLYLIHSMVYPSWGFASACLYLLNKRHLRQLHPKALWARLKLWTWNVKKKYDSSKDTLKTPEKGGKAPKLVLKESRYVSQRVVTANRDSGIVRSDCPSSEEDMKTGSTVDV